MCTRSPYYVRMYAVILLNPQFKTPHFVSALPTYIRAEKVKNMTEEMIRNNTMNRMKIPESTVQSEVQIMEMDLPFLGKPYHA
jgi:hypothetical protein